MNNSLLVTYKIVNVKLLLQTVNTQCKQLYCQVSVLAFSFCYMLYSTGHTIEIVNQTQFG